MMLVAIPERTVPMLRRGSNRLGGSNGLGRGSRSKRLLGLTVHSCRDSIVVISVRVSQAFLRPRHHQHIPMTRDEKSKCSGHLFGQDEALYNGGMLRRGCASS